ncbi:MAG: CoA activase [Spirochaetes bacterium]|nr:CoA activase [Spirochaetota bacterium]
MTNKTTVLGIDIGSISISLAEVSRDGNIGKTAYAFHRGKIAETLKELLSGFDLASVGGLAATTSSPEIIDGAVAYDSRVSAIRAAKHLHGKVGSILIVGGEKFGLVLFDGDGEYLNYRSNTSCAAGTGSFLDQQAARLSLSGIHEFSELAFRNSGSVPKIASRCAVFAKTDLIHAQQEGYSREEICDGLSFGLARNIADTLFSNVKPGGPMVFCGGVSKNRAVVKHFSRMLDIDIITHEHSHLYGAIGAALSYIDENPKGIAACIRKPEDIILVHEKKKDYYYDSLTLKLSEYPSFDSIKRYEFRPVNNGFTVPVEIDIYERLESGREYGAYLGVDIGSTSTKAVILDEDRRVLAGLYTRTSGRPVAAVQALFEGIDDMTMHQGVSIRYLGAGTTGSGRKFIGGIIGADIALDEITAHARAACELDPAVDTVIEIGGQDSKFTTLRNGMVNFSIMNHVCAAGTGSFIEEQAKKLGCPLSDYSRRAEGARAPMSSDRCTVFMERDLNYYLSEGFSVNEVLASVLHSVRDNYLTKVAIEKNIGDRVFFQGATAKNRALVAAFEQRLGRPIMVSKYCHLTGAMGVALHLHDQGKRSTAFRGIGLYRNDIPVRTEVCELCANHCKITVAEVMGETAAFGFLCGRDYKTDSYVRHPNAFDLIKERNRVLNASLREPGREEAGEGPAVTVGIPAALHLFDEMPLWRKFFDLLDVGTVTSEQYRQGIAEGKNLTGAEFCAPMAALHGHVNYLADRADYIFLPHYMENRQSSRAVKRNYCYYTQYSPSLVLSAIDIRNKDKILTPLIRSNLGTFYLKVQLFRMMKTIKGNGIGFMQVSNAYDQASEHFIRSREELRRLYEEESAGSDDIHVVFVGRPYTILSRSMNNGIPEIFSRHGIKTFFQDMLPEEENDDADMDHLLEMIHWKYASVVLNSAKAISSARGVYPVFVTSFKCTPDSYVMEYFKKIMDGSGKPYLILQLDEHDSSVGYETRIEAAIRAFRNHHQSSRNVPATLNVIRADGLSKGKDIFAGKTLLLPNWDWITCGFIEEILRKDGIDARVVSESPDSIHRSMRFNTGQCIPLNIIVQNGIDYIERHGLDPARSVIWSMNSKIACNIGMFPHYTKYLLESFGKGYEDIAVYMGDITFVDIAVPTAVQCYLGFMFGGMLRKMSCHVRPYENVPGATDRALMQSVKILREAFAGGRSKEDALTEVMGLFKAIDVTRTERPKVAIFGDLYVRDNDIMNQGLIRTIEANGGEVITTPYSELIAIVADRYIKKWFLQGLFGDAALAKVLTKVVTVLNKRYYRYFNQVLPGGDFRLLDDAEEVLTKFGLSIYHTGESMENIMKIFHIIEQHPDLSLFVQTNPAYCCPSMVTEAMADRIEQLTGIPIVTIEYDGTTASRNEDVIPYLKYPRKARRRDFSKAM